MLDIHSYRSKFEAAKRNLLESELSQHNKDNIWKFHEHLAVIGVGMPRIMK
jgi:hypothetical protein